MAIYEAISNIPFSKSVPSFEINYKFHIKYHTLIEPEARNTVSHCHNKYTEATERWQQQQMWRHNSKNQIENKT